jgi:hypothetical protein
MAIKATFASLTLSISITQEGLDQVSEWGFCDAPLIGPDKETVMGMIHVNFDGEAAAAVKTWTEAQRQAIEEGKAKRVRNQVVEVVPEVKESEDQDAQESTDSAT